MRKRMLNLLMTGVVVICSISLLFHTPKAAVVTPGGPPVQGSSIQGNCSDGQVLRCSGYYGSPAVVNSGFIQENGTGVGIAGSLNGSVIPANTLDVNGNVEIGGGSVPSAEVAVQLEVTPLNASTTGQQIDSPASPTADALQIQNNGVNVVQFNVAASTVLVKVSINNASSTGTVINSAASQSADLAEWNINGSTAARIGARGGFSPNQLSLFQVNTTSPSFVGEMIEVTNYQVTPANAVAPNTNLNFVLCIGTGAAASQFQAIASTSTGSGVDQGLNGCGTGH